MIDKPLITLRSQTFLVARSMDGILPPNYLHGLAFMMGDIFVSINLGFIKDFLTGLVDLFSWFDVTVEIEAVGVTCEGAKAPPYLLVNYILISAVIVMFDSNVYLISNAAQDLDLADKSILTKVYRFVLVGSAGAFRKFIKVLLTNVRLSDFFPYYQRKTEACDSNMNTRSSSAKSRAGLKRRRLIIPSSSSRSRTSEAATRAPGEE
mmetsp:Transcript_37678/g.102334  ORF Transcript_37678/g.102334 Transcript_37678/m.102334 type:complete len:207 (-) Transcript_37678:3421-4041(-)